MAGGAAGVTMPERHGAVTAFEVNAPSAAGAVIDGQAGVPGEQLVPKRVVAFHILYLRHAHPVRGVGLPPEAKGIDVEVVAIGVDPVVGDAARQQVREPAAGSRVTELEEAAFVAAEDEFGVLPGDLGAGR